MKLLLDPINQEYYVLNVSNSGYYFYQVLSFNPVVLKRIFQNDNPVLGNPKLVEKEMEEFAFKEYKKLNGYWE